MCDTDTSSSAEPHGGECEAIRKYSSTSSTSLVEERASFQTLTNRSNHSHRLNLLSYPSLPNGNLIRPLDTGKGSIKLIDLTDLTDCIDSEDDYANEEDLIGRGLEAANKDSGDEDVHAIERVFEDEVDDNEEDDEYQDVEASEELTEIIESIEQSAIPTPEEYIQQHFISKTPVGLQNDITKFVNGVKTHAADWQIIDDDEGKVDDEEIGNL